MATMTAEHTAEDIEDQRQKSMSPVEVVLGEDVVIEDFATVVDEAVSSPVHERKSGFWTRMGNRFLDFIERLAYPPMSVRDRLDSEDMWDEYYRYYYPLW